MQGAGGRRGRRCRPAPGAAVVMPGSRARERQRGLRRDRSPAWPVALAQGCRRRDAGRCARSSHAPARTSPARRRQLAPVPARHPRCRAPRHWPLPRAARCRVVMRQISPCASASSRGLHRAARAHREGVERDAGLQPSGIDGEFATTAAPGQLALQAQAVGAVVAVAQAGTGQVGADVRRGARAIDGERAAQLAGRTGQQVVEPQRAERAVDGDGVGEAAAGVDAAGADGQRGLAFIACLAGCGRRALHCEARVAAGDARALAAIGSSTVIPGHPRRGWSGLASALDGAVEGR